METVFHDVLFAPGFKSQDKAKLMDQVHSRLRSEAIHAQHPDVQGLCWISRQDDSAHAVMLFGDRIAPGVLRQSSSPRSLLEDAEACEEVLDLAERIGVNIVPGKS
jgi:hypothetical protein